jgi:hypothetical protein
MRSPKVMKKADAEVRRLTKVAEKLFLLHGKGVRFGISESGELAVEYTSACALTPPERAFLTRNAERIVFLLPYWQVKLFHSLVGTDDLAFLRSCNMNLEFSEESELRSPVMLPAFEPTE